MLNWIGKGIDTLECSSEESWTFRVFGRSKVPRTVFTSIRTPSSPLYTMDVSSTGVCNVNTPGMTREDSLPTFTCTLDPNKLPSTS